MTYKNYKTQILKDERSSKLNFKIDGREHFVYRITQIELNVHYYGSKTGELEVLGKTYFSNSFDKEFIKDQEENPQNYKYKIVNSFDNPADKMILEAYLHQRFNVKEKDNNFYNRANQTPFGFDTTGNKEIALKISKSLKGKIHSKETKLKMSINHADVSGKNNPNYGKHQTDETKLKVLKAKAVNMEQTKKNISKAKKGYKYKIVICPHCNFEGGGPNMSRYHFNNCKV